MSTTAHPALLAQVMTHLDHVRNVFGPLSAEVRGRVFAAVDNPTAQTWDDARHILVTPTLTLWQVVAEATSDPRLRQAGQVPSAGQVVLGLAHAAQVTQDQP